MLDQTSGVPKLCLALRPTITKNHGGNTRLPAGRYQDDRSALGGLGTHGHCVVRVLSPDSQRELAFRSQFPGLEVFRRLARSPTAGRTFRISALRHWQIILVGDCELA